MRKLKRFQTHAEYEEYITGENVILPNVSLCVDNDEVHYNPVDTDEARLVVKYNVVDDNDATYLYAFEDSIRAADLFFDVSIDDVFVSPSTLDEAEGYYQLSEGEHIVKYGLSDYIVDSNTFYNCTSITSVEIPTMVTSIGSYAFGNCENLTSITIPNSVTSINVGAFEYCTSLTSITIPNSVTSIGESILTGCDGITSIVVNTNNVNYDSRNKCNAIIETGTSTLISGCKSTIIPNSVTSIGESAFRNCGGLTAITIPSNVNSIGDYAFNNCYALANVTVQVTTPPILNVSAFEHNATGRKIRVPSESVEAYKTATNWSTYANDIEAIQ